MSPIHSSMDPIKASPDGDEQREEVARDCLCDERLAVLDMAGVGHWRIDWATRAIKWTDTTFRLHGLDPADGEPSLETFRTMFPEEDRARMAAAIQQVVATGQEQHYRLRLNRHDGVQRHVMVQARPELAPDGALKAIFGAVTDITDLEQQVIQARKDEARYKLLADNVADVITRVRPDGTSKYISPAIYNLLGWTLEEMSGDPLDYVYPPDRRKVSKAIQDALRTGEQNRLEHRAVHRDGTVIWVECTFRATVNAQHGREDAIVVIRDISDRKAMEAELREAKERAESAAAAKSEFLANMSHELRTPLTSVLGFSNLLTSSKALPETERGYVHRIATASKALLAVINDVLDYSKLEKGAIDLDPRPFNPVQLTDDVREIIETQCAAKGLALQVAVDPALPASLLGDEGRLRQVLLNLLGNAAKFTAQGAVCLHVGGHPGDHDDWRLKITVTDTGIGMTPDTLANVFERFAQADPSTTRLYGGTGLGLAISRCLVEAMGGRLSAVSQLGEGSTFSFEVSLPLSVGAAAPLMDEIGGLKGQPRILVVDDTQANRELFTTILTQLGVQATTVDNGAEALNALRSGAYDLVLMDVQMPVMDGLTATREIRRLETPGDRRIPVIALTANVQPEQIAHCRAAGMDDHLAKPLQMPLLLAVLSKWLG